MASMSPIGSDMRREYARFTRVVAQLSDECIRQSVRVPIRSAAAIAPVLLERDDDRANERVDPLNQVVDRLDRPRKMGQRRTHGLPRFRHGSGRRAR